MEASLVLKKKVAPKNLNVFDLPLYRLLKPTLVYELYLVENQKKQIQIWTL